MARWEVRSPITPNASSTTACRWSSYTGRWCCPTTAWTYTVAEQDGMHIGHPGNEVAKLIAHGFIEVSRANGHAALATLTAAGFKASARPKLWLTARELRGCARGASSPKAQPEGHVQLNLRPGWLSVSGITSAYTSTGGQSFEMSRD